MSTTKRFSRVCGRDDAQSPHARNFMADARAAGLTPKQTRAAFARWTEENTTGLRSGPAEFIRRYAKAQDIDLEALALRREAVTRLLDAQTTPFDPDDLEGPTEKEIEAEIKRIKDERAKGL